MLLVASLMLAGCSGPAKTTAPTKSVEMKNLAFNPQNLTVAKGTKVTWTNHDSVGHTVTSDGSGGPLNSPTLQPGQSYSYTFDTPGTYTYHCKPHPEMTATITVTA